MLCYGVPHSGEDVCFDNNFTVHIPYGAVYDTDTSDSNESIGFIKILKKIPYNYNSDLINIPDDSEGTTFTLKRSYVTGLDKSNFSEFLKKIKSGEALTPNDKVSNIVHLYMDDSIVSSRCYIDNDFSYFMNIDSKYKGQIRNEVHQKQCINLCCYMVTIYTANGIYIFGSNNIGIYENGTYSIENEPGDTIFSSVRSSNSSSKESLDKSKKADAEKEENQNKELKYEKAYEQWEKDCAEASIKRSHEEQIFINSEKERLLTEHQKKIDENNALIAQYTEKIKALEDEMYELGFFKFSEKAEKRNSISDIENKIAKINSDIISLRDSFNQTMANINSDEDILLKAKRAAKKKVPFPQEPWFDSPECRFKRKLSIIIEEIFAQCPGLNDANFLYEYIEEHVDEPFSKNDLYRILMKMCKNGILCSITIKNKTYYAKLDEDF